VKDASVSLVKVGSSAAEVSSRTALTLSWKNPDSVSAEMSDVEGGMTRSFRWRLLKTDHSFLEFPALEVIFFIPETFFFPFQQVPLSFHLSDPRHAVHFRASASVPSLAHHDFSFCGPAIIVVPRCQWPIPDGDASYREVLIDDSP
jgi:hypothetical protein